jgi:hypothetical protein
MDEKSEIEDAIILLDGKPTVSDVFLADLLHINLQDLRAFIRMNSAMLPPPFFFRMDEQSSDLLDSISPICNTAKPVEPVFALTIHGILLIYASLGCADVEEIDPRMVILITCMNSRF